MSHTVRIEADAVVAEINHERGATLTRLTIGGDEVLFLDPATVEDRGAKVRGGVPVLFPIAGRLTDDAYTMDGRTYQLRQHGFARDMPWSLTGVDQRSAELRLASSEQTLEQFPYRFDVRLRFRASGNTLTIEQTYANVEARPMPLAAGFHPYFLIPDADKAEASISTDASRAFDNVKGQEVPFEGLDLTQPEVDLVLLDHGPRETRIERPGRRTIRLSWDAAFHHLVVWTQKGKDFVCVEPWMALPDALRTGEGLAHIGPREVRKTWIAITAME